MTLQTSSHALQVLLLALSLYNVPSLCHILAVQDIYIIYIAWLSCTCLIVGCLQRWAEAESALVPLHHSSRDGTLLQCTRHPICCKTDLHTLVSQHNSSKPPSQPVCDPKGGRGVGGDVLH